MKRDLTITWFFPHPTKKVWHFLTDTELISKWLMKNDFKPIVGHRFRFFSKPLPKMAWDGIVYCEVLEIVPEKKLVYTWQGGPEPGVINLDTLLIWTLTAKDNGTELVLQHQGFKGLKNIVASIFMERGWKKGIARRFAAVLQEI